MVDYVGMYKLNSSTIYDFHTVFFDAIATEEAFDVPPISFKFFDLHVVLQKCKWRANAGTFGCSETATVGFNHRVFLLSKFWKIPFKLLCNSVNDFSGAPVSFRDIR